MKLKFLKKFKAKEVNYIDKMSKEKAGQFFSNCNSLLYNKTLKLIIEKLSQDQSTFATRQAGNWESVLIARGGINTLFLLEEEIEKYAACYKDEVKAKEVFDKFSII